MKGILRLKNKIMRTRFFSVAIAAAFLFASCQSKLTEGQQSENKMKMEEGHDHEHEKNYVCPIHADVTSDKPDTCPKCGMELVKKESVSNGKTYRMDFESNPGTVNAKQQVTLSFTPRDIANATDSVPLSVVHEKKIHLIIVSKDLSWFQHIHPLLTKDGDYKVSTSFPYGGDFVLFADYTPTGAPHQLARIPISVNGNMLEGKHYSTQNLIWKGDDGYEATMSFGNTPEKVNVELMPTITITKNGKAVTNLDNYLGALGHLVILSSDTKDYLHAHPMEDDTHGPSIVFHTEFSATGIYRSFLQFNHDGKIHTADFVIEIK